MNKRTFALLAAVITFTVGVVLTKLSRPNLIKEPSPVVIKEVQLSNYRLSGPYRYENLSVFLIHGPDVPNKRFYTPLQEAMTRQIALVHETSEVNELTIENTSATEEVFVQAGDIVKGGKQDRVLPVDMILPVKSGPVPIPSFCVEQSRWHARGAESSDQFSITEMFAPYTLKRAVKDLATQAGVWAEVDSTSDSIAAGIARNVRSEVSPSSLALMLENNAVLEATIPYVDNLSSVTQGSHDVLGFAFAVNDQIRGADVYSSNVMFKRFWPRLLRAAAVDAIGAQGATRAVDVLTIDKVTAFLTNAELGSEIVTLVNSRTESVRRSTVSALFFESRDNGHGDAWIHRSYLPR